MAFPTTKTNAVNNTTDVIAAHLNNLEDKVGIDNDDDVDSLDYLIKKKIGDPVEVSTGAGTITGACNGSNTAFVLPDTPISNTLDLYYEGQRLTVGAGNDYTISGATITTLFAPESGTNLVAKYRKQI